MTKVIPIIYLLCIVIIGTQTLHAQYAPGIKLYANSTNHFTFVYSDTSKNEAFYLAQFAEKYFQEFSEFYKTIFTVKILVFVTDDQELINGYASSAGQPTITIYTSIPNADSTIGNNHDWLQMVFVHELTHIFSMNMKPPFPKLLSDIFGNLFLLNFLLPAFMIEGIPVFEESREGYGRINDPLITEQILQDYVENKFKTPGQASGAYDNYMAGNIYYWYGGLFQSYLIAKYGMPLYKEYIINLPSIDYLYTFKLIYKTDFFSVWEDFKNTLAYKGTFKEATNKISESNQSISSFASSSLNPSFFIYNDTLNRKLYLYNPKKGISDLIFDYTTSLLSYGVSQDESKLILTYLNFEMDMYKSYTKIYDFKKKIFTPLLYKELFDAAFFNDSIIAVQSDNNEHNLILIDPDGNKKILYKGSEGSTITTPQYFNKTTIVFLLSKNNKRYIAFFNTETNECILADIPLKYIRNISVNNETVYFCYNNDFTFYKLAYLKNKTLYFQTSNIKGGVHNPGSINNSIFLISNFADNKMLQIITDHDALEIEKTTISMSTIKSLLDTKSYTTSLTSSLKKENEKEYANFDFILPDFVLPYFYLQNLNGNKLGISYGLAIIGMDPLLFYPYSYFAAYNDSLNFVNLDLTNFFKLFSVNDVALRYLDYIYLNTNTDKLIRSQNIMLTTNFLFYISPFDGYINVSTLSLLGNYYLQPNNISSTTYLYAYSWPLAATYLKNSLVVSFGTKVKLREPFYSKGFIIDSSIDTGFKDFSNFVYGFTIHTGLYFSFMPLELHLYGTYSPSEIYSLGHMNVEMILCNYPDFYEYSDIESLDSKLFAAEIKLNPFSIEVQESLWFSILYLNRIYPILGYRSAVFNTTYFHSTYMTIDILLTFFNKIKTDFAFTYIYAINTAKSTFTFNFIIGSLF